MTPAITIQGISKHYEIGQSPGAGYGTLRESLVQAAQAPWRRLSRTLGRSHGPAPEPSPGHWALRDVSCEIAPGQVVGIIGRNGAGKSTLLKILSRITAPTSGRVEVRGRIGSLLEVGTGFHLELTGRENIYLNGAVLGMSRVEIARKFDEIVAFSGVESFLDTPVKRYSSGMQVRLGFAVAAHLEPEILIVDEVLAVGDVAFQRKCQAKMLDVTRSGRTILFVSHNTSAVKALCTRGILLEEGRVAADGPIDEVVDRYLLGGSDMPLSGLIPEEIARLGTGEARFRSVKVTDLSGRPRAELYLGQPFRVIFTCEVLEDLPDAQFEVSINAADGAHVLCAMTEDGGGAPRPLSRGLYTLSADFDTVLLPKQYTVQLGIYHHADGANADFVERTIDFSVLKISEDGTDQYRWNRVRGYVRPSVRWHAHGRTDDSDREEKTPEAASPALPTRF